MSHANERPQRPRSQQGPYKFDTKIFTVKGVVLQTLNNIKPEPHRPSPPPAKTEAQGSKKRKAIEEAGAGSTIARARQSPPFTGDRGITIYTSRDSRKHEWYFEDEPEQPLRVDWCLEAVEAVGGCAVTRVGSDKKSRQRCDDYCRLLHNGKGIVARIASSNDRVRCPINTEVSIEAAMSLVLKAVDDAKDGSRAFCVCRPPGHHSGFQDQWKGPHGFCFVNNVVVGVAAAIKEKGYKRVAIVDFDVHLGDGTFEFVTKQINATRSAIRAQLTSDDDVRCFYASVHTPEWPIVAGTDYGKDCACFGGSLQCGRERGAHANVHLLRAHVCAGFEGRFRAAYGAAPAKKMARGAAPKPLPLMTSTIAQALGRYKPDLLFLSAGFDAHKDEREVTGADSQFGVDGAAFRDVTESLLAALPKGCPVISVLEGGYTEEALTDGLAEHLRGLGGP